MTPHLQLREEQQHLQLLLSLPQQAASSPSADRLTFFNTTTTPPQDQRVRVAVNKPEESKPYDLKAQKYMTHDGGSSAQQASSSFPLQSAAMDIQSAANGHNLPSSRKENGDYESAGDNNGSSLKWMSSKIRLMKKMTNSSYSPPPSADNKPVNQFQYPIHGSHETKCFSKSNNAIRVCSDCNTTTTPLWRSGPRGPKSLCNACGIRQRKARRAMEAAATAAAADGAAVATDATSVKIKVHNNNKEKKSRTIHVAQYKKHFKSTSDYNSHHHQSQKKLCFKGFAISLSKNPALQRVFPQDVEDAAILLMELSCGLVHS